MTSLSLTVNDASFVFIDEKRETYPYPVCRFTTCFTATRQQCYLDFCQEPGDCAFEWCGVYGQERIQKFRTRASGGG